MRGGEVLLGPGMAALLEAIGRTASLRVASEELGMSCMNAWGLVKTMYDGLREPLVALSRGGAGHGGARVTEFGEEVLALHGEMEAEALRALDGRWRRIRRLVS